MSNLPSPRQSFNFYPPRIEGGEMEKEEEEGKRLQEEERKKKEEGKEHGK